MIATTARERIRAELEQIRNADADGLLRAESVVEFARNESTALHSKFAWDDKAEAHQWRLMVARGIVRSYTAVITRDGPQESRSYVSLVSDRVNGGGYRATATVLGDDDMRAELLAAARKEMQRFVSKFESLRELANVFEAMRKALEEKEDVA